HVVMGERAPVGVHVSAPDRTSGVAADAHVRDLLARQERHDDGTVGAVATAGGDQVPRGAHGVGGVDHRNPRVDHDVESATYRVGVGVLTSNTVLLDVLDVLSHRSNALSGGL